MNIKSFQERYKEALVHIKCPCGCTLGYVRGEYDLKCGKCKSIIYGDTSKNKQYIKRI